MWWVLTSWRAHWELGMHELRHRLRAAREWRHRLLGGCAGVEVAGAEVSAVGRALGTGRGPGSRGADNWEQGIAWEARRRGTT
ncbi:hypothetical protein GUJ93_ZPchr0002g23832 [Zizania palustris]|uniref:Uncharacterized protein n=1 Tax=Zizania palustris TaxID=103762 RepID=A0A8J5VH36_ZIZPA|nr:hypothetical protein GUJ93_ZPchr0002g23832 [Zizania palustris]